MEGHFEYSIEPSGSIKDGEFLTNKGTINFSRRKQLYGAR
jgi:hypothetical protein